MSVRRIVVIGAGPKGLYCLERLAAELRGSSDSDRNQALEVHIFEPHPFPGAGPVYDPTQPKFMRMNFANGKIDMWTRSAGVSDDNARTRPTFVEYLASQGMPASANDYSPRQLVGTYLHQGFGRVVDSLRSVAAVTVHREAVQSVLRLGSDFEITTPAQSMRCDEVLLATGHGSRTSSTSAGIAPYPIDQPGGVCDIEPGAMVAVRGLGLTAIDVALALTEGRGGRFVPGPVPGQFTYEPSGHEPHSILPYSRTGRAMFPKVDPAMMPESEAARAACLQGSRAIASIAETGTGSVYAALVHTSAAILGHASGQDDSETRIRRHLESLLSRRQIHHDDIVLEMRSAVETAYGQRLPGPDWALATAWRGIYPALVRLVATRRLDVCWSAFTALATEMERVAFGPPAENAARLLALVDAGIIDMSCASTPEITEAKDGTILTAGSTVRRADVLVNAVLDPPGAAPGPCAVVASLLHNGLARTTHSAGLDVDADGTCIGGDGQPTAGLGAVGRPTEGSILGNDTLSRTLHDTPARWARGAVRRLGLQMETSAA